MKAFEELKRTITSEPIMLYFPDWDKPFEIHCDASKQAVAAILNQRIDEKERVIMYASRTLTPCERKYQVYEQECLALIWAVELFRQYIRNRKTIVRTDCSALEWLKSKKEGSRVMRWIMRLQEFDLDIQHRKGTKSGNVDGLTRDSAQSVNPYDEEPVEDLYADGLQAEAILFTTRARSKVAKMSESPKPIASDKSEDDVTTTGRPDYKEAIVAAPKGKREAKHPAFFDCEADLRMESRDDFIASQQRASPFMDFIRKDIATNPTSRYMKWDDLFVLRKDGQATRRAAVPEELRAWVLHMHHNIPLAAHQGHKRMLDQIMTNFCWPGLHKDARKWVQCCSICKKRKTPRPMRSGITRPVFALFPNHTVAIDIVGPLNETSDGNIWILTMIDVFTRWPVAVPIANRESRLIAKVIFRRWICEKGVPQQIVSDQGRELVSKGLKHMCEQVGSRKIETSGYNPTGNASVERFHKFLITALSMLVDRKDCEWDERIDAVLFAYRASMNDTTGYSPFFLETGSTSNFTGKCANECL